MRLSLSVISLIALFCSFFGCSRSGENIEVVSGNPEGINVTDLSTIQVDNREVLAIYDVYIDPQSNTFTISPDKRSMSYHFPLMRWHPEVLGVVNYSFSPCLWADIKITHPRPQSGVDAFDPRVIAIVPAKPRVSMSYPAIDITANNSVVLNQDGYTKLFDSLESSIAGNANPFLAYFKHVNYRRWLSSGTGMTSDTRRWEMDINGFDGPMQFKLVVDISLRYPELPTEVVDNAPEPVQIDFWIGDGLSPNGGTAPVEVTLLDWQGHESIGTVVIESPSLFNNVIELEYSHPGPGPNQYIYSSTLSNSLFAPEGEYGILVAAFDEGTGIGIYNEFSVNIGYIPDNPVDVTPAWLNFSPHNCFIDGHYLYTAGHSNGLHIFDISNPVSPAWVNWVDITFVRDIYVTDGYAYIADGSTGLQVVDINPPGSAHLVKTVETPKQCYGVHVSNGYAYIADGYAGLQIIDIDPLESAYIVKSVVTPNATCVHVSAGYAYVTDHYALEIIDVEPPESAFRAKSVPLPDYPKDIYVSGNYAYVADKDYGLQIIDISQPLSAFIAESVDTPSEAYGIHVYGDYAYVADFLSGLQIIDIQDPTSAYIVKSVDTPGLVYGVYVSNNYAYVADYGSSLSVISINPIESASIVNSIYSLWYTQGAFAFNNYIYVADFGLRIISFENPSSSYIVNSLLLSGPTRSVYVSGDYAFIAADDDGIHIVDISEPESMFLVKTVDTPGRAYDVFVSDGYAYIADEMGGFQIIDIEPVESAQIVKGFDTPGLAYGVSVLGSYAYVADSYAGLQIIDIAPIESAYIVKSVNTPGIARGIDVTTDYAYIADESAFQIIDIKPPRSANIVKSVNIPWYAYEVCVSGGFAYIAGYYSGLQIVDIMPPESSYIVESIDTPGMTFDVTISNGYAYISDTLRGLRIIELDSL